MNTSPVTYIVGSTGSGKTTQQKGLINTLSMANSTVYWICPHATEEDFLEYVDSDSVYVYGMDDEDCLQGIEIFLDRVSARKNEIEVLEGHIHLALDESTYLLELLKGNDSLMDSLFSSFACVRKLNASISMTVCDLGQPNFAHPAYLADRFAWVNVIDCDSVVAKR